MYTGLTDSDRKEMLGVIGADSVEDLFSDIPANIRLKGDLDLPSSMAEMDLLRHMEGVGALNSIKVSFVGAGAHRHYIPAAVQALSSRSEFYTSYTPYQAEVSQGTLVAIFEYQTMMTRLTGMDLSNASMYDGATALAEAAFMSMRTNGKRKILVSPLVHPHYREVLKTYLWASDGLYEELAMDGGITGSESLKAVIDGSVAALIVQSPNFFGSIEDVAAFAAIAHENDAHLIVCVTEALSLGLLKSPGSLGADIVCGEAQSFGNPVGFGGPLLGFLCAKNDFMRRMPGRLVGRTVDTDGNEAYVLTLQAREQHIRRDRATSNICTNQGLCALRAVIYLSMLGPRLRELAMVNHARASQLRHALLALGFTPLFDHPYFNEFTLRHEKASEVHAALTRRGIAAGVPLERYYHDCKGGLLLCATEMNGPEDMTLLVEECKEILGKV